MAYLDDLCDVVVRTLEHYVTFDKQELAAQATVAEFWAEEVRHCLQCIDAYPARLERMRTARADLVEDNGPQRYDPYAQDEKIRSFFKRHDLASMRQAICEAGARFFSRCYRDGFIDGPLLDSLCELAGIERQRW